MRDKITEMDLPSKGEFHHYLIAGDWHGDHLDDSCYSILKSYAKTLPKYQRNLIINGDFANADFLMSKKKDFKRYIKLNTGIEDYFLPKANEEIDFLNFVLDDLGKVFNQIIYIMGNHDHRYNLFRESCCPFAYRDDFNLEKRLKLKKRGIIVVNNNDWLDIGKVAITHGQWEGRDCKDRHFVACGKSVIFSHVHSSECKAYAVRNETKKAWSLPIMSGLSPEFLGNRENNWTNGFGHLIVKSNGNFQLDVKEIWDNELIYGNKIIR